MIKSITNVLIIFFIFQQLKSQISHIDQNGVNPFCDETLHMLSVIFEGKKGGGEWFFTFSVVFYLLTRATFLDVSNKKIYSFKDVPKIITYDAVDLSEYRSKEVITFF